MIKQILRSTRGKPCSCPGGKQCTRCKFKSALKPRVYLDEPRKLAVPIVISHYNYKKPATANSSTESRWSPFHKSQEKHEPAITGLCRWYKKRRALHRLKIENETEQKKLKQAKLEQERKQREEEYLNQLVKQQQLEKERKQREKEILEQLARQQQLELTRKQRDEEVLDYLAKQQQQKKQELTFQQQPKPFTPSPTITQRVKTKKARLLGKSTSAKPKAVSKHVTVKRHERYQTLTERFVNCMYRACCQFFCCFTFLLVLTFIILMI